MIRKACPVRLPRRSPHSSVGTSAFPHGGGEKRPWGETEIRLSAAPPPGVETRPWGGTPFRFRTPCTALRVTLVAGLLLVWFGACSSEKKGSPGKGQPPVPVVAATAVQRDVPVTLSAIGAVEAYATVAVKARVSGELLRVHFREGQDVAQGGLLLEIDPRPYQASLEEAAANLARDRARLKNAEEDARRYGELVGKDYVTREHYDQIVANAEAMKATVMADEAVLENARLNLGYCSVRAPLAGRTGSLLVHPGNLIRVNDENPIVIIHQVQPVYVSFSLPEQVLPEVRRYRRERELEVQASYPGGGKESFRGALSFVDNEVDGQTGTILLKATFPNRDRALWPGQFVNVVLALATRPQAVVIPAQAVSTGQRGDYVFVVSPEATVEMRTVTVGMRVGGESVIDEGLRAGEKVVIDGQLRLVPGSRVAEREGLAPPGQQDPADGGKPPGPPEKNRKTATGGDSRP